MTDPKVVPSEAQRHADVLRQMFAVCANERRMQEADALAFAILAIAAAPKQDAGAVDAVVAEMREAAESYAPNTMAGEHGDARAVALLTDWADRLAALAPPAAAPQQGDGDFLRSLAAGIAGDSPEAVRTRERLLRIAATQQPSGGADNEG